MRRDAGPGSEGHLTSSDMAYPNGVAAKALKARAADTLDKVLFELSSGMKNAYARSDA